MPIGLPTARPSLPFCRCCTDCEPDADNCPVLDYEGVNNGAGGGRPLKTGGNAYVGTPPSGGYADPTAQNPSQQPWGTCGNSGGYCSPPYDNKAPPPCWRTQRPLAEPSRPAPHAGSLRARKGAEPAATGDQAQGASGHRVRPLRAPVDLCHLKLSLVLPRGVHPARLATSTSPPAHCPHAHRPRARRHRRHRPFGTAPTSQSRRRAGRPHPRPRLHPLHRPLRHPLHRRRHRRHH